MALSSFRKQLKSVSLLAARPFAALRIPPNVFTFFSVPLALLAAFFFVQHQFFFSWVLVVLAVLVDVLDGSVAELQDRKTVFGNYWDAVVDKVVEIIFYVGFSFSFPLASILALGSSLLNSYAKPRVGLVIMTDNRDWPAMGERADRLLLLILGMLAFLLVPTIAGYSTLGLTLYAIVLMTCIGTVQRVAYAKQLIEEAQRSGNVLPYLKRGKNR